jgi:DNA topoisomerase-6 subunit B
MELESTDSKQATKVESQEKPAKRGATAEDMAARQRDISVAEFFTKNRHLLGFDSPLKSLLTAVKEAEDNGPGILP